MLSLPCPAEGRAVLLSPRRITGLAVHPDRVVVDAVCWCGASIHHVSPRVADAGARPGAPAATAA